MRRFLLAAMICAGCTEHAIPTFPMDASIRAILYAIEAPDLSLYAVDAMHTVEPIFVPGGAAVSALAYRETLEELQIAPGRVALATSGRRLPPSAQLYVKRDASWLAATARSIAIDEARLPPIDVARCAAEGGCFRDANTIELCAIPCPDPTPPAPPNPPERPEDPLRPVRSCPNEWTLVETEHNAICEPPQPAARVPCPSGQAQFYREPACLPIDLDTPPCAGGTNRWPPSLPPNAIYVSAGAPAGGDGSFTSPFATLEEAIADAIAGDTIALSRGTFTLTATVVLDANVTVLGTCAADTRVEGDALHVEAGASLRNLTLAFMQVYSFGAGTTLEVRGVALEGGAGPGFVNDLGTHFAANQVVVRDRGGAAIVVRGTAVIDQLTVERSLGGVSVQGPTGTATITRVAMVASSTRAEGIGVGDGGAATIDRVEIFDHRVGIHVVRNSAAHVRRAHLRGLGGGSESAAGASGGSRLDIAEVVAEHATAGVSVDFASSATISDADMRDTFWGVLVTNGSRAGGSGARFASSRRGIFVRAGSSGSFSDFAVTSGDIGATVDHSIGAFQRVFTDNLLDSGLTAANATLYARDVRIKRNALEGDQAALKLSDSNIDLARAVLDRGAFGIFMVAGTATITDVTINDMAGDGLQITGGAKLALGRARIDRVGQSALMVFGACSRARVTDFESGDARNGASQAALNAVQGGSLEVERVKVVDPHARGIALDSGPTDACGDRRPHHSLRDVDVEAPGGIGLDIDYGAQFSVERAAIRFGDQAAILLRQEEDVGPDPPCVVFQDVAIQALIDPAPSTGIILDRDACAHLERFSISVVDVAISVGRTKTPLEDFAGSTHPILSNGVIDFRTIGVRVMGEPGLELPLLLDRVLYLGPGTPISIAQ